MRSRYRSRTGTTIACRATRSTGQAWMASIGSQAGAVVAEVLDGGLAVVEVLVDTAEVVDGDDDVERLVVVERSGAVWLLAPPPDDPQAASSSAATMPRATARRVRRPSLRARFPVAMPRRYDRSGPGRCRGRVPRVRCPRGCVRSRRSAGSPEVGRGQEGVQRWKAAIGW